MYIKILLDTHTDNTNWNFAHPIQLHGHSFSVAKIGVHVYAWTTLHMCSHAQLNDKWSSMKMPLLSVIIEGKQTCSTCSTCKQTNMYRMYSSILGTLYTTQQLVCWIPCLLWSSLHLSSAPWIDTKGSSLQQSKWIMVQWLRKNVERLWKNVTWDQSIPQGPSQTILQYGPRHTVSTD